MPLGPCSAEATYLYHSAPHSDEKTRVRNEHYMRTSGRALTTDKNPAQQCLKKKKSCEILSDLIIY